VIEDSARQRLRPVVQAARATKTKHVRANTKQAFGGAQALSSSTSASLGYAMLLVVGYSKVVSDTSYSGLQALCQVNIHMCGGPCRRPSNAFGGCSFARAASGAFVSSCSGDLSLIDVCVCML
jgi:hypothetical protein